jgi:hypothetical protein
MKIALKWTINNFPVYEMVSGWSTLEKLACSYCMENNKTFTLTNGVKTSFFIATEGSCQVIIDTKRKKKNFLKGKAKRDVAPLVLLGEKLYNVVS